MEARQRHLEDLADSLRSRLIDARREAAAAGAAPSEELAAEVAGLVRREAALLGAADREALVARVLRDTVGLGPLEDLLADPSVEEVMVNGPGHVYVERGGRIEATDACFADEEELRNAIERILAPLGRRIDELSPMVDARLADGSRVNAVIPPLAIDGPALSIRRFGASRPGPRELVELGTLSELQVELLERAVGERRSILVSGGTGSGKTTLLTALNTGHRGALSTVHANSPDDALARLETLALMAGLGLPHEAIAAQVRRGIDLVVHLERWTDGSRRVTEIADVAMAR
jgi:pilus assembly protein CpaF